MLSALRGHTACSRLRSATLTDFLNEALQLHCSVTTAALQGKATAKGPKKSAPDSIVVAKDRMYCWLQPVLYKPDAGWLFEMIPASSEDKAAVANASASDR
jgi:hypothetical protein